MDYSFTLSVKSESYTIVGVGNLDRPVENQMRVHVKGISASESHELARAANKKAGPTYQGKKKIENWTEKYLKHFNEETFVRKVEKLENIFVKDTADGEAREITDPREIWNSTDPNLSIIANEISIHMQAQTEVPVKN